LVEEGPKTAEKDERGEGVLEDLGLHGPFRKTSGDLGIITPGTFPT
jgi:hypothetical protein